MKKTFLWLVFFLYYALYNGQSQNDAVIRPTPSIAGLSTYNTVPVSIQTGIPEISYPLISLETANKSVSVNLGLSYHAANTSAKDLTSEVGKGWAFLSGGSISREIFEDFDESFDDSNFHAYQKNEFDDIYNFNIPGESGKFRFVRDTLHNTFEMVKLTPFTSKIEYNRNNNQATLILDSFTITSETGIKYVFKDYDIGLMNVFVWYHPDPAVGDIYTEKKYRSAFYLSSILDENGQELVKYTYLRDFKYALGTNMPIVETETNKLVRIETKGYGIVEINYDKNESLRKGNDIFAINNVVLKTANNNFIKKYIFDYSYDGYYPNSWENTSIAYRILKSFSQIDSNGKTIEKYTFDYGGFSYETPYYNIHGYVNGKLYNTYTFLNKITLPTGGTILYNFEMIQHSAIKGIPRIKNIKYFNNLPDNIMGFYNITPARIEEYDYNKFDNSGDSKYLVEGGVLDNLELANPAFIYKNVKVSQGSNIGYTKYYFKAPDAYDFDNINRIWPNYNLTRGGLIDKKEVYNSLNQKVSEDVFDYTIVEYNTPKYLVAPSYVGSNFYIKTTWIKDSKVTSKNYFDSGVMETKNEVFRNNHNNKPNLERSTSFDGSIKETTYQYAQDKNNQKLISANMTGIPLETTSIIKKNISDTGKIMARSETKYDNAGNKYPSSAVSYDSQNILASEVTFNRYDIKGNLEQYTTKEGIPVSIVWGYNKTQPIAKVEGAAYDQIAQYVAGIILISEITGNSEQNFQNALDDFRNNTNLSSYQITTYLYDSLARMKIMTPPTGIRAVYQYDSVGRLEKIQQEDGKLLKKYEYNYKH
ncbi:hypothetical protein [Chryseobacterium viscerum]|uniref:RHS repeat protein n=1 Tax=Chryseobacterium viscerum TaxID=1037377 RepID=A0A5N4BLQ6_9FLAO|nr:hypothetical protein [Chryseobacterium viscerum]KAB1229348.1 hypothetical protein F8D52_17405 [Chryseobacterium viscerum]